jgi:sensor histidine kinase regulating citrate/malate metabolism
MDFAKNNTPHQYWLAQSFILLSDIYVQKEDLFQAKATLQSVIDGYSVQDDGVIDLANSKLLAIIKAEKAKLNKKGDEIELHFKNVDKREVEKLNKENEASDSLLVKNATGTEEKSTAMKVD